MWTATLRDDAEGPWLVLGCNQGENCPIFNQSPQNMSWVGSLPLDFPSTCHGREFCLFSIIAWDGGEKCGLLDWKNLTLRLFTLGGGFYRLWCISPPCLNSPHNTMVQTCSSTSAFPRPGLPSMVLWLQKVRKQSNSVIFLNCTCVCPWPKILRFIVLAHVPKVNVLLHSDSHASPKICGFCLCTRPQNKSFIAFTRKACFLHSHMPQKSGFFTHTHPKSHYFIALKNLSQKNLHFIALAPDPKMCFLGAFTCALPHLPLTLHFHGNRPGTMHLGPPEFVQNSALL